MTTHIFQNRELKIVYHFYLLIDLLNLYYLLSSVEGEFTKVLATEEWRISRVNQNYTICPGYPKSVVVPKTVDDETIANAASFRQGGRFPVLSYRHNNGVILVSILVDPLLLNIRT